MGAGMIDRPQLPTATLEAYLADERARLEAIEETVYGEHIFVLRVFRLEFRLRWITRTRRPDARMARIRSEEL